MRRVMIIGGPGSGKSTLARRIGARLGLPVTHLDQIYWKPGWVFCEHDEVRDRLLALYAEDNWVIDGNYSITWPERLARADTLIFLDLPTWMRAPRVIRRTITGFGRDRPDLTPGCPERLDWVFYKFVFAYGLRRRKRALAQLDAAPGHVSCHHLTRPRDADRFVAAL